MPQYLPTGGVALVTSAHWRVDCFLRRNHCPVQRLDQLDTFPVGSLSGDWLPKSEVCMLTDPWVHEMYLWELNSVAGATSVNLPPVFVLGSWVSSFAPDAVVPCVCWLARASKGFDLIGLETGGQDWYLLRACLLVGTWYAAANEGVLGDCCRTGQRWLRDEGVGLCTWAWG